MKAVVKIVTLKTIILIGALVFVTLSWGQELSRNESIHIRAVGDIMLGTLSPDEFLRPDEKGSILKYIRPYLLDADLTFGNLEGTLCDSGTTTKCEPDSLDCYLFRMPELYGGDLKKAGFDFLSLANNHVGDFGLECVLKTVTILDSLGIGWSGAPGSFASKTVRETRVAFLAFHSGGYCNSSLDIPAAVKLLKQVEMDHELVVISIHGGAEGLAAMSLPDSMEYYMGEQRGNLKQFAHAMIDAGADLVFGHGPHVARAMELYKGKLIAYSLGNFATYGRFNLQADRRFSGILEVELSTTGELLAGQLISIEQKYWGVPLLDQEYRFSYLVDSLSQADLPRTGLRLSKSGQIILDH